MFIVRYFNKDVAIGVAGIIAVIALGIIIFLTGGNRNDPEINQAAGLAEIPRIDVREVKEKLEAGSNLVIIDTRSRAEYEQIHIAGAVSLPLEETAGGYAGLKDYQEIITYCTWPDEATSARAAQILREMGLDGVKPLRGGLTAWKAAGYPVEGTAVR